MSYGTLDHGQMEQELAAERERMRITLASIGEGVISTDALGRVTYLNPMAETLTGWTQALAAGRPLAEVFHIVDEDSRGPAADPVARVLREGHIVRLAGPSLLLARDGAECPIDHSAGPMLDPAGVPVGAVIVFRDATERRRDEEIRARLAAIVESSQDAVIGKSLQGVIRSWNAGATRIFGYTAEEAIGKSIAILIPPDRLDEEANILSRLGRGERIEHYETVRLTKDGQLRDISLTISPIRNAEGRIVGASKVARDVTERKRTETALRASEQALREADRRKDEFLAVLAHELRNPLAPLRNSLQVMRLADGNAALLARSRDIMERQLSHLVRLVDDLLDASRISCNKMELRRSRVLVAEVIGSALETARPAIESAGHELAIELPPEPLYLDADLTRLAQVVANLLNNSAKFTDRGGHIRLTVARQGNEVTIEVRDDGIGIPAAALPILFDIFSQAGNSAARGTGLGIGLALVKGLVEMHNGTVTVVSPGPGLGSTFTIRLPALAVPAEPLPAAATASGGFAWQGQRVLVVDDNVDLAESTALMLQLVGLEVHLAHDGDEAVELAGRLRPQIILMDIGMPRLSGHDATRRIREQPWGRDITIVAVTGWGQTADRARSLAAGCDVHLVKPVHLADLEKALASLRGHDSAGAASS